MVEDRVEGSTVLSERGGPEKMEQVKTALKAYLSHLTDGHFLSLAATNGVFEATERLILDYVLISVKSPFLNYLIAIEDGFWKSSFRPKLERDFINRMVREETELNFMGLPAEMIIPVSIQGRHAKNPVKDQIREKVLLEPGTYVVDECGICLVVDRGTLPASSLPHGHSPITTHLLVRVPTASIDNLPFISISPLMENCLFPENDESRQEKQSKEGEEEQREEQIVAVVAEPAAKEVKQEPEEQVEQCTSAAVHIFPPVSIASPVSKLRLTIKKKKLADFAEMVVPIEQPTREESPSRSSATASPPLLERQEPIEEEPVLSNTVKRSRRNSNKTKRFSISEDAHEPAAVPTTSPRTTRSSRSLSHHRLPKTPNVKKEVDDFLSPVANRFSPGQAGPSTSNPFASLRKSEVARPLFAPLPKQEPEEERQRVPVIRINRKKLHQEPAHSTVGMQEQKEQGLPQKEGGQFDLTRLNEYEMEGGKVTRLEINMDEPDPGIMADNLMLLERLENESQEVEANMAKLHDKLRRRAEQRPKCKKRRPKAVKAGAAAETDAGEEHVRTAERTTCNPVFSDRDDAMFMCMMRENEQDSGKYLARSLAPIYDECRAFYKSLMDPAPCLEWAVRPKVSPDMDGFVHHVSGDVVKVANGVEMRQYLMKDLHNHREFRLGEVVWARFQREFWPGYIRAFLPADKFEEYKGDVIMIQWISEESLFNHLCYKDVYRFDMYFAIKYMPSKVDKAYTFSVARAIAMDGKPGYWEEYISRLVFDQLRVLGANLSSIPQEQLGRLQESAKTSVDLSKPKPRKLKNVTPAQYAKLVDVISRKEINHFQRHYKALYKGRNTSKFAVNQDFCNETLNFTRSINPIDPVEEEERSHTRGRRRHAVARHVIADCNPTYSSHPLFASEIIHVVVKDGGGNLVRDGMLFENASISPLVAFLQNDSPPRSLGVHLGVDYASNPDERHRLEERIKKLAEKRKKLIKRLEEKEKIKEEEGDDPNDIDDTFDDIEERPRIVPDLNELVGSEEITSHEVLHLLKEKQEPVDLEFAQSDDEFIENTKVCSEHLQLEFEAKDKKIKDHNDKIEEKQKLIEQKKQQAQQLKEEKAAARKSRSGPIVIPPELLNVPRTKGKSKRRGEKRDDCEPKKSKLDLSEKPSKNQK